VDSLNMEEISRTSQLDEIFFTSWWIWSDISDWDDGGMNSCSVFGLWMRALEVVTALILVKDFFATAIKT